MANLARAGAALAAMLAAAVSALSLAGAPAQKPAGAAMSQKQVDDLIMSVSNWGRWGKDDQLGALNLITPEKRRAAAKLVREGLSISLAHNAVKDAADKSQAFG